MTAMLSPKELASLYTRLEAPMIVADLLDHGTPLSEDENLALTIMLSEMTADQLLISIACCTQVIASRIEGDPALTSSLSLQSNFVLDDYGPSWLRRQAHPETFPDTNWSSYMQEDFVAMSDLLMLCADIFGESSVVAAEICSILQDQALAHAEVLDQADFEPVLPESAILANNIIPFPALKFRV